jgi:hypothetical protein
MPVTVQKGSGDRPYKIVEKSTGREAGSSKTRQEADSAARLRNAITEGGFKPTGKKRRIIKTASPRG